MEEGKNPPRQEKKSYDTRCRHSYELLCCSLMATIASGTGIAEGFLQKYFPNASVIDPCMGSWAVGRDLKIEAGCLGTLCSAACLEDADHSCCWGNCLDCLNGLKNRINDEDARINELGKKTR